MRGAVIRTSAALLVSVALPTVALAEAAPFIISVEPSPTQQQVTPAAGALYLRHEPEVRDPFLNVQGWVREGPGTPVEFRYWSNYAAFVSRAEIRVLLPNGDTTQPPIAVTPIQPGGIATWSMGAFATGEVDYVVRVYGPNGQFDETRPKRLTLGKGSRPSRGELLFLAQENSLRVQTIPINGSAVSAQGSGVGTLEHVMFMGQEVPVDAAGNFQATQILPKGPHIANVQVVNREGRVLRSADRDFSIADEDWFYVGLADLTVGQNATSGPIQAVTGSTQFDEEIYVNGRLAFYLKGVVKGDWLLTASADTGDGPIEDLFDNFLDKDARSVLQRLDPDEYYPVYGDDSTAINDAPTDGKLFVRLERGPSQFLWGNFRTRLDGSTLTGFSRTLYGARVRHASAAQMENGAPRATIEAFAAEPGTVQSREEFRGTGGSVYFLRHRDLLGGSERAWIETRDPVTGLVLARQDLLPGADYDVNAIQGRIQLLNPLLSSGAAAGVVTGATGNPQNYLVVTYEYSPGFSDPGDLVMGATATYQASDKLAVSASVLNQEGSTEGQQLGGVQATYALGPGSYLTAELAASKDQGTTTLRSLDGGFTFSTIPGASSGSDASAARVELGADLADLGLGAGEARIVWLRREAGFSGPGAQTSEDVDQFNAEARIVVNERTTVRVKLDQRDAPSQTATAAEIGVERQVTPALTVSASVKRDDIDTTTPSASTALSSDGARTDVQVRADYEPVKTWSVYGYGQATVERTGTRVDNNRFGLGGTWRPNQALTLGGEVSDGDGGATARITGSYQLDERSSIYSSYELSNDREAADYSGRQGQFTLGGTTKVTDNVTLLAEQTYQHGDGPTGTTTGMGLDYAPEGSWTFGLKGEAGELTDPVNGDLSRRAVSFAARYGTEKTTASAILEYRLDDGASRRVTWTSKNSISLKTSDDWRMIGRASVVHSDSTVANEDSDFYEVVLGGAYRPVENDRLNALVKYTYLYDYGAPGQVGAGGGAVDYAQETHVFSLDVNYDVTPRLALGGKIAGRWGSIKDIAINGPWVDSYATLAILRADYRFASTWDVLGEYRLLDTAAAGASQSGGLVAVYKQFDENVRFGGGFNTTDFSSNLTNQDYSSRGWFLNLVGSF